MKTLSHRYRQAHKEAKYSVILALLYFIWWYGSAYSFAPSINSTAFPELYAGLPLWFLLSCIIGPLAFTGLAALMVTFLFKDMPLDVEQDTAIEQGSKHE